MPESNVTVVINGQDNLSAVLGNVKESLGSAAESASGFVDKLGEVGSVAAGLVAGNVLMSLGQGVAEQFHEMISGTEDYAESIRKLSIQTGLSAEDASTMALAFKDTGTDMDAGTLGLTRFAKGLGGVDDETDGVVKGQKSVLDSLKELGVQVDDSTGKQRNMMDILGDVADQFEAMPDGPAKTAAAMSMFGRAGQDMLPVLDLGRDGLKEIQEEAQKYGLQLSGDNIASVHQFALAHNEMDAAIEGVRLQIGVALMPVLTALVGGLTDVVTGVRDGIEAFSEATGAGDALTETVGNLRDGLSELGGHFDDAKSRMSGFMGEGMDPVSAGLYTLDQLIAEKFGPDAATAFEHFTQSAGDAFSGFGDTMGSLVGDISGFLDTGMDPMSAALYGVDQFISDHFGPDAAAGFEQFTEAAGTAFSSLGEFASTNLTRVQELFGSVVQWVSDHMDTIDMVVGDVMNVAGDIVHTVIDQITGYFNVIGDLLRGDWGAAWQDLQATVGTVMGDLGHLVGDSLGLIVNAWDLEWQALSDASSRILDGYQSYLGDRMTDLGSLVQAGIGDVETYFQTGWQAIYDNTVGKLGGIVSAVTDKLGDMQGVVDRFMGHSTIPDSYSSGLNEMSDSTGKTWTVINGKVVDGMGTMNDTVAAGQTRLDNTVQTATDRYNEILANAHGKTAVETVQKAQDAMNAAIQQGQDNQNATIQKSTDAADKIVFQAYVTMTGTVSKAQDDQQTAISNAQDKMNETVQKATDKMNETIHNAHGVNMNTEIAKAHQTANDTISKAQDTMNQTVSKATDKMNTTITDAHNKMNTTLVTEYGTAAAQDNQYWQGAAGTAQVALQQTGQAMNNFATGPLTQLSAASQTLLGQIGQHFGLAQTATEADLQQMSGATYAYIQNALGPLGLQTSDVIQAFKDDWQGATDAYGDDIADQVKNLLYLRDSWYDVSDGGDNSITDSLDTVTTGVDTATLGIGEDLGDMADTTLPGFQESVHGSLVGDSNSFKSAWEDAAEAVSKTTGTDITEDMTNFVNGSMSTFQQDVYDRLNKGDTSFAQAWIDARTAESQATGEDITDDLTAFVTGTMTPFEQGVYGALLGDSGSVSSDFGDAATNVGAAVGDGADGLAGLVATAKTSVVGDIQAMGDSVDVGPDSLTAHFDSIDSIAGELDNLKTSAAGAVTALQDVERTGVGVTETGVDAAGHKTTLTITPAGPTNYANPMANLWGADWFTGSPTWMTDNDNREAGVNRAAIQAVMPTITGLSADVITQIEQHFETSPQLHANSDIPGIVTHAQEQGLPHPEVWATLYADSRKQSTAAILDPDYHIINSLAGLADGPMHGGGIVSGALGSDQLRMVAGGEGVFTPGQMDTAGSLFSEMDAMFIEIDSFLQQSVSYQDRDLALLGEIADRTPDPNASSSSPPDPNVIEQIDCLLSIREDLNGLRADITGDVEFELTYLSEIENILDTRIPGDAGTNVIIGNLKAGFDLLNGDAGELRTDLAADMQTALAYLRDIDASLPDNSVGIGLPPRAPSPPILVTGEDTFSAGWASAPASGGGGIDYRELAAAVVEAIGGQSVQLIVDGRVMAETNRSYLLKLQNNGTKLGFKAS